MQLITIRSQMLDVIERWKGQYPIPRPRFKDVLPKLEALDLTTATPNDVAAIIGNSSWVGPLQCNECGNLFTEVVMLGEKPDYESSTATVCKSCIQQALRLFVEWEV
uniref:Uncharacterized protein n=1 Tax=viral metagenome TaxID=1070528 RepID=A0A6M3LMC0_9ZZZZ